MVRIQYLLVMLVCLVCASVLNVHAQLSGVVTIGAGGTYATIGDFMTAFNAQGMNGNLTVRFITSTTPYVGQMFFENAATRKSNPNHVLIIESQAGNRDSVVLGSNFGTVNNVALIYFAPGYHNVIIRNITVVHQNQGTLIAGIRFDDCNDFTVRSTRVELQQTTSSGFCILGTGLAGTPVNNTLIRDNILISGSVRISVQGLGLPINFSNMVVANNLCYGSLTGIGVGNGMFFTTTAGGEFINSRIDSNVVNRNGADGIQIGTLKPNSLYIRNNIIDTTGTSGRGISYIGSTLAAAQGGRDFRVLNNVVRDAAVGGILAQMNGVDSTLIENNVIFRRTRNTTTFTGIQTNGVFALSTNIRVLNNTVGLNPTNNQRDTAGTTYYGIYGLGTLNNYFVNNNTIRIDSSASTYYGIWYAGTITNFTGNNNTIEGRRSISTWYGVYVNSTLTENGTISNNRIRQNAPSSTCYGMGLFSTLRNTLINDNYVYVDSAFSSSNTIAGYILSGTSNENVTFVRDTAIVRAALPTGTNSIRGFWITSPIGTHVLNSYAQIIHGDGILASSVNRSAARRGLIANNMIIVGSSVNSPSSGTTNYGLHISGSTDNDYVYNSISVIGDRLNSAGLRIASSSGARNNIMNNSFANFGAATGPYFGYDAVSSAHLTLGEVSNNNYFTATGTTPMRWFNLSGSQQTTNLAGYRAVFPTLEGNSISTNPGYINTASNLRVNAAGTNVGLNGMATPVPSVTTDFDNIARAGTPDIGCSEFSVTGVDAGISMISPRIPVVTDTVVVQVGNARTTPITSLGLSYVIGSGTQVDQSFTVNIPAGGSATLRFTQLASVTSTTTASVFIRTVNGAADANQNNDTARVAVTPSFAGDYTIDPNAASTATRTYTNLQFALNDMALAGMSGAVRLNLVAGTHTTTATTGFVVPVIPGSSAQNSLTIRSAGASRSARLQGNQINIIEFGPSVQHAVLSGVEVVSTNAGTSTARAVFLNSASNIRITDNRIESVTNGISTVNTNVQITGGVIQNIIVENNLIQNAVYSVSFSLSTGSKNIHILNNVIENFDRYGINYVTADSIIIRGNELRRPNKGIPVSAVNGDIRFINTSSSNRFGNVIERNYIHTSGAVDSSLVVGIYLSSFGGPSGFESVVRNNVITNLQSAKSEVRGILNWVNAGIWVYNNTISLTEPTGTGVTGTGAIIGLDMNGTSERTEWRNNIVVINGTGPKNKFGATMTTFGNPFPIFNNNLYFVQGGTNAFVGGRVSSWSSTTPHTLDATQFHATLAAWQTATGQKELNSVVANPTFTGSAPFLRLPATSPAARRGAVLTAQVANDYEGTMRSPFFDIGAFVSAPVALIQATTLDFGNVGRPITEQIRIDNSSISGQAPVNSWTLSNTTDFRANPVPPATFNVPTGGNSTVSLTYGTLNQTRAGSTTAQFQINSSGVASIIQINGFYASLQARHNASATDLFTTTYNYGVLLPGAGPSVLAVEFSPNVPLTLAKGIQFTGMEIIGNDEGLFRVGTLPSVVASPSSVNITFTPPTSGGFGRKTMALVIRHTGANSPDTIRLEANVGVPQLDVPSSVTVRPVTAGVTRYASAYDNVTLIPIRKLGLVDPVIFTAPIFTSGGTGLEILQNGGRTFISDTSNLNNVNNWSATAQYSPTQSVFYIAVRLREPMTNTTPGAYSGVIRVAQANPVASTLLSDVFLSVVGQVLPADPNAAEVFPLIVEYGRVPLTQPSERMVTLRNRTASARQVMLSLTNDAGSVYSLATGVRTVVRNVTIPANSSLEVPVYFTPVSLPERTALLNITGLSAPITVSLRGEGFPFVAQVDTGRVYVRTVLGQNIDATSTVNFGTVNVGAAETMPITIVNTRQTAVQLDNISRAGINPSQFIVEWMPRTIEPGQQVNILVSFAPSNDAPSLKTGIINIFTSQGIQSFQVRGEAVRTGGTGIGNQGGQVYFQQPSLSFGNVGVGTSSARTALFINERSTPVWIDTILVIAQSGIQQWSITPMSASRGFIQPGTVRSVAINFAPLGFSGSRTATVVAVGESGNLIRTMTVGGNAVNAAGRLSAENTGLEIVKTMPNPAVQHTSVSFRLSQPALRTTVRIFDAAGRVMQAVEQAGLRAGEHTIDLNLSSMPSGAYFYVIEADGLQATASLQVVK